MLKKLTIISILLPLLLLSCAVDQQIMLNKDGSGTVETNVYLEGFFLSTLQDLTGLTSSGPGGTDRLAPETIEQEMAMNPFFYDIAVDSPSEGVYGGSLKFNHIEELLGSAGTTGGSNIITYTSTGADTHRLDIRINSENFEQVYQLFPVLQDPGFQYFMPEPGISEAEYSNMLFFIFDGQENLTEEALRSLIRTASLKLLITVDGSIISLEGGEKLNDSTMRITLPLVELLMHRNEINYSLSYRG